MCDGWHSSCRAETKERYALYLIVNIKKLRGGVWTSMVWIPRHSSQLCMSVIQTVHKKPDRIHTLRHVAWLKQEEAVSLSSPLSRL